MRPSWLWRVVTQQCLTATASHSIFCRGTMRVARTNANWFAYFKYEMLFISPKRHPTPRFQPPGVGEIQSVWECCTSSPRRGCSYVLEVYKRRNQSADRGPRVSFPRPSTQPATGLPRHQGAVRSHRDAALTGPLLAWSRSLSHLQPGDLPLFPRART